MLIIMSDKLANLCLSDLLVVLKCVPSNYLAILFTS